MTNLCRCHREALKSFIKATAQLGLDMTAYDSNSNHHAVPSACSAHALLFDAQGARSLSTSAVEFEDNYALNEQAKGMPTKDITVAFWARTPKVNSSQPLQKYTTFLNYATLNPAAATSCGCSLPLLYSFA